MKYIKNNNTKSFATHGHRNAISANAGQDIRLVEENIAGILCVH